MDEGERLIEQLGKARSAMKRALCCVEREREICPGWTVKEMLAHIAGWDKVGASTVRAHVAGETPQPLEVQGIDAYNAYLVAQSETITYEEMVQGWKLARRQFTDALAETPPEKLKDQARFPWGETGTIARLVSILVEHEREHATEILEMASAEAEDSAEVGGETE